MQGFNSIYCLELLAIRCIMITHLLHSLPDYCLCFLFLSEINLDLCFLSAWLPEALGSMGRPLSFHHYLLC